MDDDTAKGLVKLACQRLGEGGRSKIAAAAAGVSEGRWSHFAGMDHMDKNLPVWRAILIEQRLGSDCFRRLFADADVTPDTGACPRRLALNALTTLATLTAGLNDALEDDDLNETERRELATIADRLCAEGAAIKNRLAGNVQALRRAG